MTQTDNHAMAQAVHDLGSAMWFGGTLMGATGVNKAGRDLSDEFDRIRVAKSAWIRFQPLQWSGIAMTVLAGLQLTRSSAGRLAAQQSFGTVGAIKAGLTALGIASTVYAAYCGRKIGHLAEAAQDRDQLVVDDLDDLLARVEGLRHLGADGALPHA